VNHSLHKYSQKREREREREREEREEGRGTLRNAFLFDLEHLKEIVEIKDK